jgi:4,5-dihydroxyphthalate decarboxylase
MNSSLDLAIGCGLYDRTMPLVQGLIQPNGLTLKWNTLPPGEILGKVLEGQYAVGEMSLAYLSLLHAVGDRRFVGIPIFLSRMFRHSALFVKQGSRLDPKQLRRKRIGVSTYTMTAAVWLRWFLRTDYGIMPEDLRWVVGDISPVQIYSKPPVQIIPGGLYELERMLLADDLDLLLSVVPPTAYLDGRLRRLWVDSRAVERAAAEKHKLFPIMHTLVMLRSVYEQNPWAATSLFNAFCEAKDFCYQQLLDTDAPVVSLPWLCGNVEEAQKIFGKDYWPYGLKANLGVLEAFFHELELEGLVKDSPSVEQVFLNLER